MEKNTDIIKQTIFKSASSSIYLLLDSLPKSKRNMLVMGILDT